MTLTIFSYLSSGHQRPVHGLLYLACLYEKTIAVTLALTSSNVVLSLFILGLLEKPLRVRLDSCITASRGHRGIFKTVTMLQFSTFATAFLLPQPVFAL